MNAIDAGGFGQLVGEVLDRKAQVSALDRAASILLMQGCPDTARIVTTTAREIERTFASSAVERTFTVDVPMIEAACAELLETSGLDLGGDEMRLVLQAALRKATPSASKECIERCEQYLHGTAQGSVCGLRKMERDTANLRVSDREGVQK